MALLPLPTGRFDESILAEVGLFELDSSAFALAFLSDLTVAISDVAITFL